MNKSTPVSTTFSAQEAHMLLRGRYSIRHYRPEMPADAVITRIFESVAMAPSAHNRQPWRYLVISAPRLKANLANAMGVRLAADRRRDGDPEAIIQADVSRSYRRITGAPIIVVAALTMAQMDRYPDEKRNWAEYLMAVQSTAMATQNLLLAVHAEGLGACWICAPLFCPVDVRNALSMPEDWEPQGLITLGYPDRPGKLKPRKPLADFMFLATACDQAAE